MAYRKYKHKRKRSAGIRVLLILIAVLAAAALALGLVFLLPHLMEDTPVSSQVSSTPTVTTTTTASTAGIYVTTDALNMRSGPSTEHEVLGVLPKGTVVEVLGTENGWHRIHYQGKTAYVSADYVTRSTTGASTTTTTVTTTTTAASTTGARTTVTEAAYTDRYLDENGLLQFKTDGRYVQASSYADTKSVPWNLVLVNDWNPVPKEYDSHASLTTVKGGQKVDARILNSLNAMLQKGQAVAADLQVVSGYRPSSTQNNIYWREVRTHRGNGISEIKAQSAAGQEVKRPGYSEHNCGLAVDLGGNGNFNLNQNFENTAAFKWLIENCAEYGFVLRFPKGKEAITGVIYEPWHYRYVGVEAAKYIMENNLCLEEYLEQTKQ